MKFEMLKCDKCGKKFEISAMSDCFQVNIESLHMADGTFSELNVAELCPECHKQFLNDIRSYCSRGRFAPLNTPNEDDDKCTDCMHYPKNGITSNAICLKCNDYSEYVNKDSETSETSETIEAAKDSKDISLKSWEPSETLASSIEVYKALEKHSENSETSETSEALEAAKDEKPQIERLVFHNITEEQAKDLGLHFEDVDKVTKENLEKQAKIWKAPEIKAEKSKPRKSGMGCYKTCNGKPTKVGDIRFYIIQNKLTPQQIAEKCGVHFTYVYKIKRDMKKKGEI